MSRKLFDECDCGEESKPSLNINKAYADKYETWRQAEERQKLIDKHGDVSLIDRSDSEEESESEDDDGEQLVGAVERDFLCTLAALKRKDPRIYDSKEHFFNQPSSPESSTKSKKKEKPMTLKDYERQVVTKTGGKFIDEDDERKSVENGPVPGSYAAEQEAIRDSFKRALLESDGDDDNSAELLKKRVKTNEEKEQEDLEYFEWLKGQKDSLQDESTGKELKSLKDYWNRDDLDPGEKFLRDFILNKRYKLTADNDEDDIPTYDQIVADDPVSLEEDESILDRQEDFERKYNFRFEEPDAEFIKSYPRTIKESVRRQADTRKEKRESLKQRKEREKEQRKAEIHELKSIKRKEMSNKLAKLREITGDHTLPLDPEDLDTDFDPAEHDRKMQQAFGDEFYQQEDPEGMEKPVWSDSGSEISDNEDWDNYEPAKFQQDEPLTSTEKPKKSWSKFAKAVKKPKPMFDPTQKTFEQYLKEYYQLDLESMTGQDTKFKYRSVPSNDFGLSTEEILVADEKELNAWVSLKKTCQYRSTIEENNDQKVYAVKGRNVGRKKKVLRSVYDEAQQPEQGAEKSSTKQNEEINPTAEDSPIVKDDKVEIDNKASSAQPITSAGKRKRRKKKDKSSACADVSVAAAHNEVSQKKQKKKPPKEGKKSDVDRISDERLKAYGLNPTKVRNKAKYGKKTTVAS